MSMRNMTIGQIQELVENPGQPIRQPATALLTVDTADRVQTNNAGYRTDQSAINDAYINKQQTLMNGYITRVALTEINIPWNIPNVNSTNNSFTFNYLDSSVPEDQTVRVDIGLTGGTYGKFYTPADLATELETLLNANAASNGLSAHYTFRVQYNEATQNFNIDNATTEIPPSPFKIVPKNKGQNDDLLNMMGFGGVRDVAAVFFTGGYASMLYTPYFDIISQQLTKKQNVKDNSTSTITGQNLLARVYLTPDGIVKTDTASPLGCAPFTIHKEFQNPKQIYWDTKEFINVIDLQLRDYKGNILFEEPEYQFEGAGYNYGTGNTNWQMTFQITET